MKPCKHRGFTLLELLTTLLLLSIATLLAAPSFNKLVQNNRDEAMRTLLVSHLSLARTQAVVHRKPHSLCGSSDGKTCDGNWSGSWLVRTPGTLISHQSSPIQSTLCWVGFSREIVFQPNGATPTSNGRFVLCRNQKMVWSLTLNRQGRIRNSTNDPAPACCATSHTQT